MTDAAGIVRAYHQRTKHRFEAYAPGPETLDWDAQPAPFRHFDGAPRIALPSFKIASQHPSIQTALRKPLNDLAETAEPLTPNLDTLSVLLQLSLGITAWKTYGPDRWAVRANPSSGNLHPVEAYLITRNIAGLENGIYHYCPDDHVLELRAGLPSIDGRPGMWIALSSVMWREAWKYGERAFRYCQLDVGHAAGALRYAAGGLGWPLTERRDLATDGLAHALGLDRAEDFGAARHSYTETEEAEALFALQDDGDIGWLTAELEQAQWHGRASVIDRHPMYRWPVIAEVAAASRHAAGQAASHVTSADPRMLQASDTPAAALILHRRSAQRFDARFIMPREDFFAILQATLPIHALPWDALGARPRIALVLFVHRVDGLTPGLYCLPRTHDLATLLESRLHSRFACEPVEEAAHLGLLRLATAEPAELHRVARSLHCHQDIAANACFALGMIAEFAPMIDNDPAAYRDLLREAGLIGQVLYLHAEAHGLRGTGIGCYFDDPVHTLLGLEGDRLQSLYHFTVGRALDDPRIATTITSDLEFLS